MKIAIIGYGNMGKTLERVAKQRGHEIVAKIDPYNPEAAQKELTFDAVKDADVCIDFTNQNCVMENIWKICSFKKNIVVGTTGWYDKINDARAAAEQNGVGLIYASNFSIGMNIFFRLVENASKIINLFDSYDVAGIECHHNKKVDSPSGTAKKLSEIIVGSVKRKDRIVYDLGNRKIEPNELQFASLRCGAVPGTHKIIFDSDADTIELLHCARNREGFALGAVMAAEWISGKKGFYEINDLIKEKLGGN